MSKGPRGGNPQPAPEGALGRPDWNKGSDPGFFLFLCDGAGAVGEGHAGWLLSPGHLRDQTLLSPPQVTPNQPTLPLFSVLALKGACGHLRGQSTQQERSQARMQVLEVSEPTGPLASLG